MLGADVVNIQFARYRGEQTDCLLPHWERKIGDNDDRVWHLLVNIKNNRKLGGGSPQYIFEILLELPAVTLICVKLVIFLIVRH